MLRFSKTASPIVVWNVTKKCNLSCAHCYINAVGEEESEADMGELTTREAMGMIEDLAAIKAPMLASGRQRRSPRQISGGQGGL